MAKTKIQWCDYTFNPWRGCAKVSAGCDNCYAAAEAKWRGAKWGVWGPADVRVLASDAYWKLPLTWNRAALAAGLEGDARPRVFCGSLMDVFEDRPELVHWRAGLLELIDDTPNLQWMLLTKRPQNVRQLMPPVVVQYGEASYIEGVRENVWLGASIENQDVAMDRIGWLLAMPAQRRFLSLEPLLGPIDLLGVHAKYWCVRGVPESPRDAIHEVIIGGESGPAARACRVEWIVDILRQCDEAGIPAYVKQLGANPYLDDSCHGPLPIRAGGRSDGGIKHPKGGDPAEWPVGLAARAYAAKTK